MRENVIVKYKKFDNLKDVYNAGDYNCDVLHGDRIAQMVLAKVEKMQLVNENLSETERNSGGFGSTGVK